MQIWKFEIKLPKTHGTEVIVEGVPFGADFLRLALRNDTPVLWMKVDITRNLVPLYFYWVGSTLDFDDRDLEYIDTVQVGSLVWHLFVKVGSIDPTKSQSYG